MSVGETPQRANDSHASLPTAWQTTSLMGPQPAQGAITGANAKTNIYPGKWFSGGRLLMQTQELHSSSRRCCSPQPWHLSDLMITLIYSVLESRGWLHFCQIARGACERRKQAFLKPSLHKDYIKVLYKSITVQHLLWHHWLGRGQCETTGVSHRLLRVFSQDQGFWKYRNVHSALCWNTVIHFFILLPQLFSHLPLCE